MAFKFVVFAALVAISRASIVSQPLAYAQVPVVRTVVNSEYDANPQYSYAYDVQDPFTGDSKSQVESRSGDIVQGQYALNDPDGTRRTVDYTADPINGFNAVVRKSPLVQAIQTVAAAPVVQSVPVVNSNKVVEVASPVVAKVSSPVVANVNSVAYSAPVSKFAYSAPASQVAYSAPVSQLAYSAPVSQVAYSAAGQQQVAYAAPVAGVVGNAVQSPVAYASGYAYPYNSYPYNYNAYSVPYVRAQYY